MQMASLITRIWIPMQMVLPIKPKALLTLILMVLVTGEILILMVMASSMQLKAQ